MGRCSLEDGVAEEGAPAGEAGAAEAAGTPLLVNAESDAIAGATNAPDGGSGAEPAAPPKSNGFENEGAAKVSALAPPKKRSTAPEPENPEMSRFSPVSGMVLSSPRRFLMFEQSVPWVT
jgi:hypothetical protein